MANYGRLPLHFIVNQGQVDPQVRFYARRGGSSFFFTRTGMVLTLPEAAEGRADAADWEASNPGPAGASRPKVVVRLTPVGQAPGVKLEAVTPLSGRVNYFTGNDPQKWRSDLPTYRAVVYREAYPGIDLKFYGNGRQLEYDIIVRPGADPSKVKFRCQGVEGFKVTPAGDLVLKLPGGGELVQKKPRVYQEIDGKRQVRAGRFRVQPAREGYVYGFTLAAYDRCRPLVIDPVLLYSTYLGGNDNDHGYGIAVDRDGCAYVTGETYSTDFPTHNPYGGDQGDWDAFITKLSPGGSTIVYSTYLGGSSYEDCRSIAVDGAGCAYVTGRTDSINFPTENPFQVNQGAADAFVTKLSAAGNALAYSTYLGGSSGDYGSGIAVDGAGCAYVIGVTASIDFPTFPTQNPFQGDQGGDDAFVTKLSPEGNTLIYSTYLGSSGSDYGHAIAVDSAGCAYVTGQTSSTTFPTFPLLNPYQGSKGGGTYDAFVTKLSAGGNAPIYSTYLGGSGSDYGRAIAVDGAGCAYVTGETSSGDFPKQNPCQGGYGGGTFDAFVTKLNAGGVALVYSTYLGGSVSDIGYGIAVDGAGCAYVTGATGSGDFPKQNPYQGGYGGGTFDAFVTKLRPEGNTLVYSTYLGGSGSDIGYGIAVDFADCAYVTCVTASINFPTRNPYQGDQEVDDAFVAKLGQMHIPLELLLD